jgi:hypothetical protein
MESELEKMQTSRLLVQRLQALLLIAAALLLISLTPWGSSWSVFVSLAPEWQGVPNAVPYLMPHEYFVEWVAHGWAGVVLAISDAGLLDGTTASMLIRDGLTLAVVLRSLVLLLLIVGWLGAVQGLRRASPETSLAEAHRVTMESVEPKLGFDSGQSIGQSNAHVLETVAQQQLIVQNILLDPQAQPVSEPLMQLAQNLQGLEQELRRHQSAT